MWGKLLEVVLDPIYRSGELDWFQIAQNVQSNSKEWLKMVLLSQNIFPSSVAEYFPSSAAKESLIIEDMVKYLNIYYRGDIYITTNSRKRHQFDWEYLGKSLCNSFLLDEHTI